MIDSSRQGRWVRRGTGILAALFWLCAAGSVFAASSSAFQEGVAAYVQNDCTNAIARFGEAIQQRSSAGAWHNLGNAEWQAGRVGSAILAWERARWIDPRHAPSGANLAFARKTVQLEGPDLTWYEVCSTWLPASWWPWLGALCFWGSAGWLILPGALRWRRRDWFQGAAAAGFAAFLLVLPALGGIQSRSQLGVVIASPAPLRLAPSEHAQFIGKLHAGETVRSERQRGRYHYVRAGNDALGWVDASEVGWIAAPRGL